MNRRKIDWRDPKVQRNLGIIGGLVAAIGIIRIIIWMLPVPQINIKYDYFTDDEGDTLFVDSHDKNPPFDHNGKPAVLAYEYSYDNGNKRYVGLLMRYTPELKAKLDNHESIPTMDYQYGTELHAPKGSPLYSYGWVPYLTREGHMISAAPSPDGTMHDSVFPGINDTFMNRLINRL